MKNTLIILAFGGAVTFEAQIGGLNRASEVTIPTELIAYAVDPASIQTQIDAINAVLAGGITTNLTGLVIVDGIVTGTL